MGQLIIHPDPDPERLEKERAQRFLQLPPHQKLFRLCNLIRTAVLMNGGRPLKQPQGKGLVLKKQH